MSRFNSANRSRLYKVCTIIVLMIILLLFLREELFITAMMEMQELNGETSPNINNGRGNNQNDNNENAIYFDDTAFNELVEHSSSVNEAIFPSDWLHLNDQLFCPIKYSQTLSPSHSASNGDEVLLKVLYRLQFKANCFDTDESNKFLVFDVRTMGSRGIGACINAMLLKIMFRAIYSNRTLLLIGQWRWTKPLRYCNGSEGMSCYMLPTSNCNYKQILSHFGRSEEYKGTLPTHCDIGDNKTLPLCSERILTINKRSDGWGYFPMPSVMDKWLLRTFKVFNFNQFRAVCTAFFFRLQPRVRRIVYEKVKKSVLLSLNSSMNPFKTLSLPIRQSDKCKTDNVRAGEMDCWSEREFILFLDSVSFLSDNRIDTVIITSESTQFLNNLTAAIKEFDEWKYSEHKWRRIVVNKHYISSQIGAADYRQSEWMRYSDDRLATQLEFDPIVGALSSMLLQIANSQYIAHTKSSNWLDLIFALSKSLNCHSIFWREQLQTNGFGSIFLQIDTKCFEFIQWGIGNKLVFKKSITYPPDLWEVMKQKFKNDKEFEREFGIRSKSYRPCTRFDVKPYQRSDTEY